MTITAQPALAHAPGDYIDGAFRELPGDAVVSVNPADPDDVVWQGSPSAAHLHDAVAAARRALPAWSAAPMDERINVLRRWQAVTKKHAPRISRLISREMGKTLTESLFEANALGGKVDITLDEISMSRVRDYDVPVSETREGHCRFKPHGVMAVVGPFNFPAHLPNGHFVPAMLMGNTIVFKPSEKTPAVGQLIAELMHEAGVPAGVFNLVQGTGAIAAELVSHDDIDGILFTGSWPVGRRILEANLDRPGRIVALEMGGNNAAVVMPDADLKQAIIECVRAGFATTGQRCTCTRRIILHRDVAERFVPAFCRATSMLVVGPADAGESVFMGPIISADARDAVLAAQAALVREGAKVLVQAAAMEASGYFLSPCVVEVDRFTVDRDEEVFGPFVQITIVDSLEEAVEQTNASRYGLAASIFTADEHAFRRYFREVRCGCINWNTGTAGASSKLPFGGLGHSGNHRPAAAFSVDYCAYPVANMIERSSDVAVPPGMPWADAWL